VFRRLRRPGLGRRIINAGPANELIRANQLLAAGQPEQAAILFAQLAEQMKSLGRPRQAANLHAQAAHAWVSAGAEGRALNQARLALDTFTSRGMIISAAEFKARFAHHLREAKLQAAASAFEQETDLPAPPSPAATPEPARGRLPAVCPQCGAPVRSDSVEWIDKQSAECDFCSATIQTLD